MKPLWCYGFVSAMLFLFLWGLFYSVPVAYVGVSKMRILVVVCTGVLLDVCLFRLVWGALLARCVGAT